jgi:hypothetical protein
VGQQAHSILFSITYPDRPLDPLTTFVRIFTAISAGYGHEDEGGSSRLGDLERCSSRCSRPTGVARATAHTARTTTGSYRQLIPWHSTLDHVEQDGSPLTN